MLKYQYQPLSKGDYIPNFNLASPTHHVSVSHFCSNAKPIALFFYAENRMHNENYAYLDELNNYLNNKGGSLLIITGIQTKELKYASLKYPKLQIYTDVHNEITNQFGLYDYHNPIASWISGIDNDDTHLQSIYLVNSNRSIVFCEIDYDFTFFKNSTYRKKICTEVASSLLNEQNLLYPIISNINSLAS